MERGPATTPSPTPTSRTPDQSRTTSVVDGNHLVAEQLDLEAALSRIASLDDEQLQNLVTDLDSALAECRGCLVGDADMDLVSVAAGARIALRRRKAAAARRRAFHRVRQLTSTENE
ncbi:hypothetical protein ABZX77_17965 [Streptomyces sp. NPDC004237]|uniref:hypothetical protein n=1 Tax=Streptomyces sp. NPDC004237 TaxID=3154455 RepID=UPI0033A52F6D